MKLKKYLTEAGPTGRVDLDDVMPQVAKDCLPYIRGLKNSWRFLYTGRRISDTSVKKKVRKDRRPVDTPDTIHKMMDKAFQEKFGVKARSQSIFASVDKEQTEFYGSPYYLFPVGRNYQLIWSNEIRDLYTQIGNELKKEFTEFISLSSFFDTVEMLGGAFEKEVITFLDDTIDKLVNMYDMDKEMNRTDGDGEVMVVADSVWLVSADVANDEKIAKWIKLEV